MSQVLGTFGSWISQFYGLFLLGGRFETYEPLTSLIFQFSFELQ
jgi:hypothetical protein